VLETLQERFQELKPDADFWSLRFQRESSEKIAVRQDILQPVSTSEDQGVMLTVVKGGGLGYAATSDLSKAGLARALEHASEWAVRTQGKGVMDFSRLPHEGSSGEYATPVSQPWRSLSLGDKVDLLREACQQLKTDERIVDWAASLWHTDAESHLLTSAGGVISQRLAYLIPDLRATANQGSETQTRTYGRMAGGRQGGLEVLEQGGWRGAAPRVAEQALALLTAPNCPEGDMDVVLAPDQMVLQIHEAIGHPLELDRILGDERNYAGTSFVTPDMFGSYQYGSSLLNITFDPTLPNEMASYGFDDEGTPASKEFIIKDGLLLRGLGGSTSQLRSGLQGVANSRACSWNRPPIDRMANLNLEPGESTFEDMIESVERGVYMQTNTSWSIDDSRNKFQFGCEYAQLIEDGELKGVVKNPNYRGISATFWRNLKMVGNQDTFDVMGTPFCGKGEPNQVIRVGHATPTCLFNDVAVFGGA
jgi:predicted Zn-dependent protease